jgi:hypothetical protein
LNIGREPKLQTSAFKAIIKTGVPSVEHPELDAALRHLDAITTGSEILGRSIKSGDDVGVQVAAFMRAIC